MLDQKPLIGTSTALNVISKPLSWWASGMAVSKFGWLDPKKNSPDAVKSALISGFERVCGLSTEEYGKLVTEAYRAHADNLKQTAKAGVDLHSELEHFVKAKMKLVPERADYEERIQKFILWSDENVNRWLWSEGYCYSEILWVGGISDAGAEMKNGKLAIFDFKSSKDAYFTQFVQDAGYAVQIEENGVLDKQGNVLWKTGKPFEELYIVPFGAEDIIPRPHYDVQGRKRSFMNAVELYKDAELFAKK